ncbi:MAG: peptide chain release factor 2 [Candidatus Wallbacteria bacterium]|nr:peptide chain release factor 2 [Candidatus Wallbacteria bacterium]
MSIEDLKHQLEDVRPRIETLGAIFDPQRLDSDIKAIEQKCADPAIWSNQSEATKLTSRLKLFKTQREQMLRIQGKFDDVATLFEMYAESPDDSLLSEASQALPALDGLVAKAEFQVFLNDKYDARNAIVSIHPGAGGTESCDWAQMLMRMFVRWAEREGYDVDTVDLLPGDVAGIKSATLIVKGEFAYGNMKSERGVHRLVRISPYDSAARRHTSFVSVDVMPEIEEEIEITINPTELRIDVYRSGGPGGQGVNTTDSAVRIRHLPTNIVVTCQNERSQTSNKITAMRVLKSRLLQEELKKQEEEMSKQRGVKKEIAWGSQIRSYVLQPYQMIKDHRTDLESPLVDRVLDGEIDGFIRAYLKWNAQNRKDQEAAGKG